MTFQDIQNKDCLSCNFGSSSCNVCQIKTDFEVDEGVLMVVGDFPGKTDATNDTVFQSGKEAFFWEVALNCIVGAKRWQFYPTYAVKCRSIQAEIPAKNEVAACKQYLINEIALLKPKAILLLGAIPCAALGVKGAPTKLRGSILDFTIDIPTEGDGYESFTTKLVPTHSPMYVVNNRAQVDNFARDIHKAYMIATGGVNEAEQTNTVLVETMEGVQEVINYCLQTKEVCFDFETTEIDEDLGTFAPDFKATLISLSFQHGSSYAIPLEHFESPFSKAEVVQIIGMISRQLFQNSAIRKIAHNLKYDWHVAAHYGFPEMRGRLDDTMLMHQLLDETIRHGLKEIVPVYYPTRQGYQDEVNKYKWLEVPLKVLAPYGGTDTDSTFRLCTILESQLLKDERLYSIYRNQVMLAIKPLFEAERNGMLVDRAQVLKNIERATFLLDQQIQVLLKYPQIKQFESNERKLKALLAIGELQDKIGVKEAEISELKKALDKAKNVEIPPVKPLKKLTESQKIQNKIDQIISRSIHSLQEKINAIKTGQTVIYEGIEVTNPNHIGDFMYSPAGLAYPKFYDRRKKAYTKTTEAKVIKRYTDHTGFIRDLLILRSIQTNINTFMKGLLAQMDSKDMVHTSFLQHGTVTGRMSCVDVDTLIYTDRGLVRIGDLIPITEGVLKLDGQLKARTHKGDYQVITHAINKGYEEMYRVELESGHTIECTMAHRFYTNRGWASLKTILSSSSEYTLYYDETYLPASRDY